MSSVTEPRCLSNEVELARPKTIARSAILAAAEQLISERGGLHFTLDMVAAKAGISKGGLTYTYPSKDALIEDMLRHELERFMAEREALAKGDKPHDRMKAHIAASAAQQDFYLKRAAHLMAALSNDPRHLGVVKSFYRQAFELADPSTPEGRRARHCFLATEGLFLLRGLGLMDVSDEEWDDIFEFALSEL